MNNRYRLATASLATLCVATSLFGQLQSQGVRLLSHIPLSGFSSNPGAGAGGWGYTSSSGREYALMQLDNGTSVVEITNPEAPVQINHIYGPTSIWHEIAVCGDYAYAGTEAGGGLQIIDLRNADSGLAILAATYTGLGFSSTHTVQANPATKYVYCNGSNRGFVMLDVTVPTIPVERARWTTHYVHDSQVVSYTSGPYAGKEIAFLCCTEAGVYIVDVTNKSNIQTLSHIPYFQTTNGTYCHSGQLSQDGKYFYVNDEFDEGSGLVSKLTTHIIDVQNLSAPFYVGGYTNNVNAIDHNTHRVGSYLYMAAYREGFRLYDLATSGSPQEIGYFDVMPGIEGYAYEGAWAAFAGFPSGNVMVSDRNNGLWILDPSEALGFGAPLTAVNVVFGTALTGGLKELRKDDGAEVKFRSTNPPDDGVPLVTFTLDAATTITPSSLVDLSIKLRTQAINGTATVWLRNWLTSQDVMVLANQQVHSTNEVLNIAGLSGSQYVGPNGQLQARVQVQPNDDADLAFFDVFVDLVKLSVRRS